MFFGNLKNVKYVFSNTGLQFIDSSAIRWAVFFGRCCNVFRAKMSQPPL